MTLLSSGRHAVARCLQEHEDTITACPWRRDHDAYVTVDAVRAVLALCDRDDYDLGGTGTLQVREIREAIAEALDGDGGDRVTATDRRWGPWPLDPADVTLDCPTWGGTPHRVDLRACRTSAHVLDEVIRVAAQPWAEDTVIAGLVRALDAVLRLSVHLCPQGRSRTITRRRCETLADLATRRPPDA
ncbi:hypothetical protein GCM10010174_61800 [Kutzneria viridogrisea]|uniref:Uncharacterized protein n=1 Tax=Kutzneria viridogrisea TaxID=47990 RepID=A0ABR6BGA1_9PSEU|nr:hypothetical protein [Kutzneria viridogrisea]